MLNALTRIGKLKQKESSKFEEKVHAFKENLQGEAINIQIHVIWKGGNTDVNYLIFQLTLLLG